MKIEAIKLKNFKAFQNAELKAIPSLCIIIGANGTGKSTLFQLFQFLKDAYESNVNTALSKLGGARGFEEVRSRNESGPIEIEIKFRVAKRNKLITYFLRINEENKRAYVETEFLQYRRRRGPSWKFIDFKKGEGNVVVNESTDITEEKNLKRERQKLKSNDILAVKGLAQFERFPVAVEFAKLLENWNVSDFQISKARLIQETGHAEHLSPQGENLSLVIQHYYKQHKECLDEITTILKDRIPGVTNVTAKDTEDGRVLLTFEMDNDKKFLSQYVSDGTIKILAYLVLLYDPSPHPLLCIEEPENQLYHSLLEELIEECRNYSTRSGGQIFLTTHSPDLLNAATIAEVFWLEKEKGITTIKRASDDTYLNGQTAEGNKLGDLWKQNFMGKVHPQKNYPSHQGKINNSLFQ